MEYGGIAKFSYKELDDYVQTFNECKHLLEDVQYYMHNCFPESDYTGDLETAERRAQLLLANTQAMLNAIQTLKASVSL